MSGKSLGKQFDINHQALQLNVAGLTHEESLIQPPKGGNHTGGFLQSARSDPGRARPGERAGPGPKRGRWDRGG